MASGFAWFRWLVLLVLVGRLSGQVESAPHQAWLGVWAGELPEHGTVVLRVSAPGQDRPLSFELWWLFYDVTLATNTTRTAKAVAWIEDGTLYLDRQRHSNFSGEASPGVAFRLVSPEEMRLAPYGVLHPILPPVWANLVLKKDPTGKAWHNRREQAAKLTDWKMMAKNGGFTPLPVSWPAAVVMPTTLLFSHNSSLLVVCLAETELPIDFLRLICAMAQELGPDASFTTNAWRTLAANPHTPTEVLEKIWAHPDDLRMWYLTAAHPQARPEWRVGLVDRVMRGGDHMKMLAAIIETGPDELYPRLIADSFARRLDLAGNLNLPAFVYELLARDHAIEVGDKLARNTSVPAAALDTLVDTGSRERKFHLLTNKSLRPETKSRLLGELLATATVRDYGRLATQEGVPPEFLAKCAEDPDPWVRIAVLRNPSTDQATLSKLTGDESLAVARQAREQLRARFPAVVVAGQREGKPPTLADLGPSVVEQYRRAVANNDLGKLHSLTDYLRNRGSLVSCLKAVAPEVIQEYRPEIMELFLGNGLASEEDVVTQLAALSAHEARWLAYFKAKGVLNGRRGGEALAYAMYSGRNDNLAALLAAGVDPKSPAVQGTFPLHYAVRLRNPVAVKLLLEAGADPNVADDEKLTPLSRAVGEMLPPAIELLDKSGLHRDRLAAFARAFPPAPDSRLLGRWEQRGGPPFTLTLYPDGTGIMHRMLQQSVTIGWRPAETGEAVGTELTAGGGFGPERAIRFRLNAAGNEMEVTLPGGKEALRLKRSVGNTE